MKCASCGADHEVLDVAFEVPTAYALLSEEARQSRAKCSSSLCRITSDDGDTRCFVRCVMEVRLLDHSETTAWGFWACLEREHFKRVVELWNDPDQGSEPAMPATLANEVPGYEPTLGLPLSLQLQSATERPHVAFRPDEPHRLARQCAEGVTLHQLAWWLAGRGPVGRAKQG